MEPGEEGQELPWGVGGALDQLDQSGLSNNRDRKLAQEERKAAGHVVYV